MMYLLRRGILRVEQYLQGEYPTFQYMAHITYFKGQGLHTPVLGQTEGVFSETQYSQIQFM